MNRLLKHYLVDVEFPDVSGAEHLQMLQIREELAALEKTLPPPERQALDDADRRLLEQADAFYTELSCFIDLAQHRKQHDISPRHWWWYLDVLVQLPAGVLPYAERAIAA